MNCDLCGSKMKVNKPYGNASWSPFWGCTTYPKCKGTKKIEQDNSGIIKGQLESFGKLTDLNQKAIKRTAKRRINADFLLNKALKGYDDNSVSEFDVSLFPYMSFPYKQFNELQQKALKFVDKDVNLVVCSPTSSGKTSIAEMIFSRTLFEKSVSIYLCPLRALASQRHNRWSDKKHDFSKKEVVIHTGDVSNDMSAKSKLNKADIIIQTSEMLYHKSLHPGNLNNYLFNVGCIAVDEAHLLCEPSRGSELECGLEKFSSLNPEARIIFLSATMENADELASWLTQLNGKKTELIETTYRPCELKKHYTAIEYSYDARVRKQNYCDEALHIVLKHKTDKFIIFVHDKSIGRLMLASLEEAGIQSVFHSRDLKKEERAKAEHDFEHGKLRVIVATSTLAIGLDLPARRVVITGTKRANQKVSAFDINQMLGRAGRPSFDKEGDAHILIDDNCFAREKARINETLYVESQLTDNNNLLFHVLICVYCKFDTIDKIFNWYRRTLSAHQGIDLSENDILDIMKFLIDENFVSLKDGKYEIKNLGKIACWFYMNPLDIRGWVKSFSLLNKLNKWNIESVLWALCGNEQSRKTIVSNLQAEIISDMEYVDFLDSQLAKFSTEGQIKNAATLYCHIKGKKVPNALYSTLSEWKHNAGRFCQTIKIIDDLHSHWRKGEIFEKLSVCLNYGVDFEKAELVTIENIGAKRAETLFNDGIETVRDILKNRKRVKQLFGNLIGAKIIKSASSKLQKEKT